MELTELAKWMCRVGKQEKFKIHCSKRMKVSSKTNTKSCLSTSWGTAENHLKDKLKINQRKRGHYFKRSMIILTAKFSTKKAGS